MTKADIKPVLQHQQQAENFLVLGIIAQGLSHRIANQLNTISLNSELSIEVMRTSTNLDLLTESLSTITRVAQTGGQLVHAVNEFARSGTGDGKVSNKPLGDLFADAEDLLNLKSTSLIMDYAFSEIDSAVEAQVDAFAVSAVLACLIYIAMVNEVSTLTASLDRQSASVQVHLRADNINWSTLPGVATQVLSFAYRVIAEQGGSMLLDNSTLFIKLPRSESV